MSDDFFKKPGWVLAVGAALALLLLAFLYGMSYVLPALGVMWSLAVTGTAAGFTIAPEIGSVAAYGTAATGAGLSILLAVKITREAKKEPVIWGAPVLGALSTFLMQMCEPFWSGPKVLWLVFSLVAGLLMIIGGVLYSQKGRLSKCAGGLATIVAPGVVFAATLQARPEAVHRFVFMGNAALWFPLVLMLCAAVLLAVLAHVAEA